MKLSPLLGVVLLLAAGSSCKAGAVGAFIEPAKPTAAGAVGELECTDDQSRAEPLIVDWGSSDRTKLEVAMRDGIVVIGYSCNSFRVLDDCRVGGQYKFSGVSRKEDVIQIVSQGELHANFPLGAAKFATGLDRSSAIDVALVTVGKHRSATGKYSRVDLEGDCDSATHFVRSAVVGAFAVGTGTRGHASTVAELFKLGEVGGSSTSEQQALNRDGVLEACGAANPLDEAPPPQCQSLLRVEIVALADLPVDDEGDEALPNICTVEGFVWDGAKCTKPSDAHGYRCEPNDSKECAVQCEAGNADSCYNLASLTAAGLSGVKQDRDAATALYAKACDGDSLAACSSLAFRLDWKAESERVIGLLQKSCDGGNMVACWNLGLEFVRGTRLAKDETRGEQLLVRACSGGNTFACTELASLYYVNHNQPARGLTILRNNCEGGSGAACSKMGGWLSRCEDGRAPGMGAGDLTHCEKFPDTNAKKATLAFESSCRAKYYGACRTAGDRYANGKGVTADPVRAHELYSIGCPFGQGSCEALGRDYEAGNGAAASLQAAYDAYAEGCDRSSKGDCYEAARVAKKLGNDTDHVARLEKGCSKSSRRSCDELAKQLEKSKQPDKAKLIYEEICTRQRDKAYCDAFVRLGGELAPEFKTFPPRSDRKPDDF